MLANIELATPFEPQVHQVLKQRQRVQLGLSFIWVVRQVIFAKKYGLVTRLTTVCVRGLAEFGFDLGLLEHAGTKSDDD